MRLLQHTWHNRVALATFKPLRPSSISNTTSSHFSSSIRIQCRLWCNGSSGSRHDEPWFRPHVQMWQHYWHHPTMPCKATSTAESAVAAALTNLLRSFHATSTGFTFVATRTTRPRLVLSQSRRLSSVSISNDGRMPLFGTNARASFFTASAAVPPVAPPSSSSPSPSPSPSPLAESSRSRRERPETQSPRRRPPPRRFAPNEQEAAVLNAARTWLDETASISTLHSSRFPLQTAQARAHDILQFVIYHRGAIASIELINAAIEVWERLIQWEQQSIRGGDGPAGATSGTALHNANDHINNDKSWLRQHPKCINTILLPWKRLLLLQQQAAPLESQNQQPQPLHLAIRHGNTANAMPPSVVWTKLVQLSSALSNPTTKALPAHYDDWWFDLSTLGIVSTAAIQYTPRHEAPLIAEHILNFARQQWQRQRKLDDNLLTNSWKPDAYTYTQVLQAWSQSDLPQASQRMSDIWNELTTKSRPSDVSYNVVVAHYSRHNNIQQVQSLLQQSKDDGLSLNSTSTALAIQCLVRECGNGNSDYDCMKQALALLHELLEQTTRTPEDTGDIDASSLGADAAATSASPTVTNRHSKKVEEAILHIMAAYSSMIRNTNASRQRMATIQAAEALVLDVHQRHQSALSFSGYNMVLGALVDMYAYLGTSFLQKSVTFLQSAQVNDKVKYKLLVEAYVKNKNPAVATQLVYEFLDSGSTALPTEGMIGSIVNAWAASPKDDAFEQALALVRRMDADVKCQQAHVRSNVVIWGSVLKCLTSTSSKHSKQTVAMMAISILDELETLHRNGHPRIQPDVVIYTLVLKACMLAGDTARTATVWKRMEQSDSPPNARTYNDAMSHLSHMESPEAALESEQLLQSMKERAKATNNADDKPDSFSYSILMNAWAKSGDPETTDRLWDVYQLTLSDGVAPSIQLYKTLIATLSHSKSVRDMQRADAALKALEEDDSITPLYYLYSEVVFGYVQCRDGENAARVLIRLVGVYLQGGFGKGKTSDEKNDGHPKPKLFQAVVSALIRSGDLLQATMVMEKMQELYDANQLPEGPDVHTYESLLAAWTEDKARRGEQPGVIAKLQAQIGMMRRKLP